MPEYLPDGRVGLSLDETIQDWLENEPDKDDVSGLVNAVAGSSGDEEYRSFTLHAISIIVAQYHGLADGFNGRGTGNSNIPGSGLRQRLRAPFTRRYGPEGLAKSWLATQPTVEEIEAAVDKRPIGEVVF